MTTGLHCWVKKNGGLYKEHIKSGDFYALITIGVVIVYL